MKSPVQYLKGEKKSLLRCGLLSSPDFAFACVVPHLLALAAKNMSLVIDPVLIPLGLGAVSRLERSLDWWLAM